jgi:hypothetical protein
MLEAHAPHLAIHNWKDFFVHIATIVVGLFIAVGLEQTVEFFHHMHQRNALEEQMHEVFVTDVQFAATDVATLNAFRSYLVDLQKALAARRDGRPAPATPDSNDPRSVLLMNLPGLAPYEAAKQNATVALLSADRLRMYNRIDSQSGYLAAAMNRMDEAMAAVNAFNDRFDPSGKGLAFVEIGHVPDLARLAAADLAEYQALIGRLINATDLVSSRLTLYAIECRAVLDGAREDRNFIDVINAGIRAHSKLRKSGAGGY